MGIAIPLQANRARPRTVYVQIDVRNPASSARARTCARDNDSPTPGSPLDDPMGRRDAPVPQDRKRFSGALASRPWPRYSSTVHGRGVTGSESDGIVLRRSRAERATRARRSRRSLHSSPQRHYYPVGHTSLGPLGLFSHQDITHHLATVGLHHVLADEKLYFWSRDVRGSRSVRSKAQRRPTTEASEGVEGRRRDDYPSSSVVCIGRHPRKQHSVRVATATARRTRRLPLPLSRHASRQ